MSEQSQLDKALEFAEVYNNIDEFPAIIDVAKFLELAVQTVKNKSSHFRKLAREDETGQFPELIYRAAVRPDVPMSENVEKFKDWGPDECIDELRRVAMLDEERVISRHYFAIHSEISESVWNRFFGTFEEFKRQAGIKLSRQQHAMERKIAVHASVDHYRKLNEERKAWAGRFERNNPGRFKTFLGASDLHDKEIDPFFLRVFIETAARMQPDVIILGGDVFDLMEFGRYIIDPRDWDVVGRIRFVHDNILRPLRKVCPNAQIDLIEGNHEARLLKHMADQSPALRAVLSDLHGMTVAGLLGLEEFEVNYVAQADLAAWTKRDQDKEMANNFKVYWDSFIVHHFPHGRNMGMPGFNGHHHKHELWSNFNPVFGDYEWHQLGCGHRRRASYTEGDKWAMGFIHGLVDTQKKDTVFDYVTVKDIAHVAGEYYHRNDDEFYPTTRVAA